MENLASFFLLAGVLSLYPLLSLIFFLPSFSLTRALSNSLALQLFFLIFLSSTLVCVLLNVPVICEAITWDMKFGLFFKFYCFWAWDGWGVVFDHFKPEPGTHLISR